MATVEMYRTSAPTENPHSEQRGIAIEAPYNEEVHPRIKTLPTWAWEWRSDEEVWVVDVLVWEGFVAPLLKEVYGDGPPERDGESEAGESEEYPLNKEMNHRNQGQTQGAERTLFE